MGINLHISGQTIPINADNIFNIMIVTYIDHRGSALILDGYILDQSCNLDVSQLNSLKLEIKKEICRTRYNAESKDFKITEDHHLTSL